MEIPMAKNENDPIKLLASLETHGYRELVVDIDNVKLTLAPLSISEMIKIFEDVNLMYSDEIATEMRLKVEIIAHSIVKVNDTVIDTQAQVSDSVEVVSRFGEELVDFLFLKYCELDTSIRNLFEDIRKRQDARDGTAAG